MACLYGPEALARAVPGASQAPHHPDKGFPVSNRAQRGAAWHET